VRAVVVYESMYGNSRKVATAIADGLRPSMEVTVVPTKSADRQVIAGADLLVVGGPTHVHARSRPSTRKAAVDAAAKANGRFTLDPDADGPGVREWVVGLDDHVGGVAAFDTRMRGPAVLTGRAGRGIHRTLRRRHFHVVARPMSFLVGKDNQISDDELARARSWGAELAAATTEGAAGHR
jgi:hypothetical protein